MAAFGRPSGSTALKRLMTEYKGPWRVSAPPTANDRSHRTVRFGGGAGMCNNPPEGIVAGTRVNVRLRDVALCRELTRTHAAWRIAAPGPIDEDNFLEWEALIAYVLADPRLAALALALTFAPALLLCRTRDSGPDGTAYEGGLFPAVLTFPRDYPLSPPSMRFTCDMYHPNGTARRPALCARRRGAGLMNTSRVRGTQCTRTAACASRSCIRRGTTPTTMRAGACRPAHHRRWVVLISRGGHRGGASSERWSPVQSVEKILLSVVSMLAEPNDESGANIDASVRPRRRAHGRSVLTLTRGMAAAGGTPRLENVADRPRTIQPHRARNRPQVFGAVTSPPTHPVRGVQPSQRCTDSVEKRKKTETIVSAKNQLLAVTAPSPRVHAVSMVSLL